MKKQNEKTALADGEHVLGHVSNDATIIGDLDAPEARAVLDQTITIMSAQTRYTPGNKWAVMTGTVGQIVDHLSKHPVAKSKDGEAFVYATAPLAGRERDRAGNTKVQYTHRLKSKIEAVTALAIDVDGTAKVEDVRDKIADLGLFAVIYTTFSHAEKATPNGDRFRVILFLSEPFPFPEEGKARYAEYESRYAGVCQMLGLEDVDSGGFSPNQMMYTPRRASEDAAFKHFIIAGRALDLSSVSGDASKYKKEHSGGVRTGQTTTKHTDAPAFLSDGFDLRLWWEDGGGYLPIEDVLDAIGWEDRGSSGGGRTILCPNDAAHSNPGDPHDAGCWVCQREEDFVITCLHDHCRDLGTWDFLRLIEANILEEVAVLPDEYATFSDLLCDSDLYPIVDGEEFFFDKHDYGVPIPIDRLTNARKVQRAFEGLPASASRDRIAALYAGVESGGGKAAAVAKLNELVKTLDRFNANDLRALKKRGSEMWAARFKEWGTRQREAELEDVIEAMGDEDLAHPSLDPAEPLGDTSTGALATLAKRFAPIDLEGKFRIVRKPDLNAFQSDVDSTVVVYGKHDFLDLHLDRQIKVGDEMVNPAKLFLESAKRKSGMGMVPPPLMCPDNHFNMYQGRKLQAKQGTCETLTYFIKEVICKGDQAKFDWLFLWMAHMVQRPGEKPGTAVICRGEGGVGKGSFGQLLGKLAAPHFKQLEKQGHVVGQFAGEHLSKCILAVVNEAVFGRNPQVASELKALVDSATIQAEVKGMRVVGVPSYIRLYFDSNDAVPILIEGNGSERRYFVIEPSTTHQRDKDYFKKVHEAINGDEMAALLYDLERYDPASAGFEWADVRDAPATAERDEMAKNSMSAPMRRLADVLEDGMVTMMVDGEMCTFAARGGNLRVPKAPFAAYLSAVGDRRNPEDSDIRAMLERLHPEVVLSEGQGAITKEEASQDKAGTLRDRRWVEFPTSVIGSGDPTDKKAA